MIALLLQLRHTLLLSPLFEVGALRLVFELAFPAASAAEIEQLMGRLSI